MAEQEEENNSNSHEDSTNADDTNDANNSKGDINPLDELSTADIVEFVGTKTAKITNPFVASTVVGAVSAVNFFIDHFNDNKGKKKKKKKNKNKNKKNKDK